MKSVQAPDDLIDEELSGVCFIRDYVEFHFDGPILRALSPVEVADPTGSYRTVQGVDGWRDRLCALIGFEVTEVIVADERAITLRFDTGDQVAIPLDQASRVGPEAAHFVPFPQAPVMVW